MRVKERGKSNGNFERTRVGTRKRAEGRALEGKLKGKADGREIASFVLVPLFRDKGIVLRRWSKQPEDKERRSCDQSKARKESESGDEGERERKTRVKRTKGDAMKQGAEAVGDVLVSSL